VAESKRPLELELAWKEILVLIELLEIFYRWASSVMCLQLTTEAMMSSHAWVARDLRQQKDSPKESRAGSPKSIATKSIGA
jgi:hypothetical protein